MPLSARGNKARMLRVLVFWLTGYPSWLYVSDTTGWTPRAISLRADYDLIPFGVDEDAVWIEAPEASDSPYALPILS